MLERIICGDAIKFLQTTSPVKCIFVDPPDNIHYNYIDNQGNKVYNDRLSLDKYYLFLTELVNEACNKCDIFWMSYNQLHDLKVKEIVATLLKNSKDWTYKQIIWRYTFGQYSPIKFSSGYRPIILLQKQNIKVNWDAIRESSRRMELKDKRACGPRVPDDVWEHAKIVGNAKERRSYFPTQHPEKLMERIIKYSVLSNETYCELCLGSGTGGIVANRLGVDWIGVEQSKFYCDKIGNLLNIPVEIQ